ncbi:MAG: DNA polymerase III subunit gamma/tau [Verrucomicrobiae bacterium]|nr:DNA polymerase III subunit gamma/tau [Verrucomicrobiae bacterium]
MSYLVIARKYRPQRFADVVGQEHVTTTLMNAIRSGRIAHAYLFCGPRGTGKTTLARIVAKALNATDGPRTEWDEADPRVREITEGRSLDVLEIDGASNNGVEAVRELRETARFAPAAARFKIYIIDEVHMLTTGAFNALLKTLEEPPAHVKFLFATTDPEKVLPTILSRCQRFDLRRIPSPLIVSHLSRIAAAEGVQVEDAALHAIARGAEGGMRDAQSTLDQLISFCGTSITESDVLSMFGLASRSQLLALSDALLGGEVATALRLLDELARNGKDLGRLLGDLLLHFRNLMLCRLGGDDRDLVEVSDAEWVALQRQSPGTSAESVGRILEVLTAAEGRLREAPSKRIFLEVTLLKAVHARQAVSLDTVLSQLRRLRDESSGPQDADPKAAPPRPARPPEAAEPPSPPAAVPATPPAIGVPLTAITLWDALHASMERSDRMLWTFLQNARALTLENGQLRVEVPADALALVAVPRVIAQLKQRARDLGAADLSLAFVPAPIEAAPAPPPPEKPGIPGAPPPEAPAKATRAQPQVLNREDFLNDPLIREAMEVFRAQLVEVRAPSESPS